MKRKITDIIMLKVEHRFNATTDNQYIITDLAISSGGNHKNTTYRKNKDTHKKHSRHAKKKNIQKKYISCFDAIWNVMLEIMIAYRIF